MAVDEQHRQVQIAVELDEAARTLAHSTRDVPRSINSYRLLAELGLTVDHLQQTVRQLSAWHRRVTDGRKYLGEDENGDGVTGTLEAAEQLEAAALNQVCETQCIPKSPVAWCGPRANPKRLQLERI